MTDDSNRGGGAVAGRSEDGGSGATERATGAATEPNEGDDARDPDGTTSAWGRTLREANEMAATLADDGWDVVTVRAGHAAPEPPERGDDGRFGLVYLAPNDVEEGLRAAVTDADLDRYEVFRRRVGGDCFLLTRLSDLDERVAVVLVGAVNCDGDAAAALRDAARERGLLYSHVHLIDGTRLLSVEHDDPAAFFPDLE